LADAFQLHELYELHELYKLFRFFNVDYLTAFVCTGLGVDAVGQLGLARVFIEIELRRFQRVVGTPRACACM
jgi:hypothetical protein